MASPVREQSDNVKHSNVVEELSSQEIDQTQQNIPAQNMVTDSNQDLVVQHRADGSQSLTSEFHHHAVEEGAPSAGSAFHVVSHTDVHKDRVINEHPNSELDKDEVLETASEDSGKLGTLFSAHIVEQHKSLCEDISSNIINESQHKQALPVATNDDNILLGISEKTAVVSMNTDDPDVVEKTLHTKVEDGNFNTVVSKNLEEDLKNLDEDLKEISDTKLVTDFQFLKPTILESNIKDTSVVGSNVDNDVESELKNERSTPFHKPEEVFNIDEETRMGLDQTPIDPAMIEPSFTYPTLPPKKLFHLDDTKDSEASDTETKMSAICDTEDIRLRNTISIDDATKDSAASDSNAETPTPSRKQRRASRDGLGISTMEGLEAGERVFTADNLFEYQWPQDGGEWHLLQEQISEYLKVKSFKRKYPDLYRRTCDKEEKDFLRDKGVVTETQSDLGLTALRSEEVYDLMMKDYNSKYKEYISHLQEKQKKVIREKHKEYSAQAKLDKSKIETYSKKAARSAAEFNASLMRDRKEERRAYFDLQTYTIHFPKNKFRTLPPQCTKVGAYPVALIPGQYQENYKIYSTEELKYYPLNTSLKDPPKVVKYVRPPPPGAKLPISDKQKTLAHSDGEDSYSSGREDNEEDVEKINKGENDVKENDNGQVEGIEIMSPFKLEKKIKVGIKRKSLKTASPDRLKKLGKKSKDGEVEKSDDKINQEGDEKGTSPEAKKMPAKIHGLEKCRICKNRSTKEERKAGKLVKCAECGKIGHMSCLDLTEELVAVIKTYPWQCMECKTCVECLDPYDEDKMMFCDRCDRGYHTFCIGLQALPTGHWECKSCEGSLRPLEKTKPSMMEGNLSERLKKVSQVTVAGSPLSVKHEPEVIEIDGGEIKGEDVQTSSIGLQDPQQADLVCDTKEEISNEKDGIASSGTSSLVRGNHRNYKRGKTRIVRRTKGKLSQMTKPSKEDRITGARQSKRLKIKEEVQEERRKRGNEKMLKRKKKNGKLAEDGAEVSVSMKLEAMEESEGNGLNTDRGFVQDGVSVVDLKEVVSEEVDDSLVNVCDKNDNGDESMEVTHSVVDKEIIGVQLIHATNVVQKDYVDASSEKIEDISTQEMTDLSANRIQEVLLGEENCPEDELISSNDKNKHEPAYSLTLPDALRTETMSQAVITPIDSQQETTFVDSNLHGTESNSLSSIEQSVHETLTSSNPIISAPDENLQPQTLPQSQSQSTSSSLLVEDVSQHIPLASTLPLQHLSSQTKIQLPEAVPPQELHAKLQNIESQTSITHQLDVPQQPSSQQTAQLESEVSPPGKTVLIPTSSIISTNVNLSAPSRDVLPPEGGHPLPDTVQSNSESMDDDQKTSHPLSGNVCFPAESSLENESRKDTDEELTSKQAKTEELLNQ